MKRIFALLLALGLGGHIARSAPIAFSALPTTNNPSVLSLVAISALTGASTYTSRAQTISNLVQTTIGIVPQFITSSNNLVSYANSLVLAGIPGLTNTTWHLTNAGTSMRVMSNATVYGTWGGVGLGIMTNSPQAGLHIYSGNEPGLLIESPTDDIAHLLLRVKGLPAFSITTDGQMGGVLNLYDELGASVILFNPGGSSYLNLTNGLAIGTNNPMGFGLAVAGNAYIRDGLTLAGATTNLGTFRSVGAFSLASLTTNRLIYTDAGGVVSASGVAPTNVALDYVIRAPAVAIAGTNTIDWSTKPNQFTTVSNDTAFTFSGGTNYSSLTLTIYNDGTGTRNLYWPQVTHLDSGQALPATLGPTEFTTIVFRKVNGNVHAAAITAQGFTGQTNGVSMGLAQYLNLIAGSGVSFLGTNTVGSSTTNHLVITATGSGGGIATLNGLGTNTHFHATTTNDSWRAYDNGGGLAVYVSSNGNFNLTAGDIAHVSGFNVKINGTNTLTLADGALGINTDPSASLGATLSIGPRPGFNSALVATPATGSAANIVTINSTNGVPMFQISSNGLAMANNSLVVSNQWFKTYFANTNFASFNGTNFVVDFNRAEVELPSSVITNGIFIVHTTNGPPDGSGTNCFTAWNIDTGNTNRHLYLPSGLQGNIYGTNTTTPSFMLPSNTVVRVVFEKRTGLISGTYMSYPAWTP